MARAYPVPFTPAAEATGASGAWRGARTPPPELPPSAHDQLGHLGRPGRSEVGQPEEDPAPVATPEVEGRGAGDVLAGVRGRAPDAERRPGRDRARRHVRRRRPPLGR